MGKQTLNMQMEKEIRTHKKISCFSLIIKKIGRNWKKIGLITVEGLVKLKLHLITVKNRKRNNDAHQNAYLLQRAHQLI